MKAGADGFSLDVKACPGLKGKPLKYYDPSEVLRKAQRILDGGGHVELIYLIVTGFNDELACIEWFLDETINRLGYDVPIHFNRYYPAYRYHERATSLNLMYMVRDLAGKKGLAFIYLGNIGDTEAETTFCSRCRKPLLVRSGGYLLRSYLIGDRCPRCGERLPIRGKVSKAYL
jgi:pyruvate formate lyase activating enzyme